MEINKEQLLSYANQMSLENEELLKLTIKTTERIYLKGIRVGINRMIKLIQRQKS